MDELFRFVSSLAYSAILPHPILRSTHKQVAASGAWDKLIYREVHPMGRGVLFVSYFKSVGRPAFQPRSCSDAAASNHNIAQRGGFAARRVHKADQRMVAARQRVHGAETRQLVQASRVMGQREGEDR